MTCARLDRAIVIAQCRSQTTVIDADRFRQSCDRMVGEDLAAVISEPGIRRGCLYQIRKCIVFRRVPSFAIEDQHGASWIVRTGEIVGDGDVTAAFVDEALAAAVDENPFIDKGLEQ